MNAVFEPIRIQSATEADLEFVLKAENDESNRKFIIPWTLEKHSQALANPDMATFIVFSTDSNERVGHAILAGLQNENQSVEFMRVVITQKGRGYGRKVLQSDQATCLRGMALSSAVAGCEGE